MFSVVETAVRDRLQYKELLDELEQNNKALRLINSACFSFQNLDQARSLASLVANACPESSKVIMGLSELLINAVEHGNLGISYDDKTLFNEQGVWLEEVEKRLQQEANKNKFTTLEFQRSNGEIKIVVKDQGSGVEIGAAGGFSRAFFPDDEPFASYRSHYIEPQNFICWIIENTVMNFRFMIPDGKTDALEEISYETSFLEIRQKIQANSRKVGSIRLRASLINLHESFVHQTLFISGLLFAALFVAFLLANYLQKLISLPVLHLADVMRRVSSHGGYALRAKAESKDELGDLINGFNQMLDRIQQHEKHLSLAIKGLNIATMEAESAKNVAERANQSKSEFLANMSHELRTPMHSILSFSNLGIKKLEKVPLTKLEDYFTRIHDSGTRLMRLLDDLLDLAKLEAGRMEYNFEDADLAKILDRCVGEREACLQERGTVLNVMPSECNTMGVFDPEKIAQVIVNLLSNAIKFTPEGKQIFISIVEDSVPVGRRKGDQGQQQALRLVVRDEGVGIPKDEFDNVFDKFIQSSKTKSGAGGTGLGLAICKEIIEGHHGRIWAENAPNDGAVFSFVIPVKHTEISAYK